MRTGRHLKMVTVPSDENWAIVSSRTLVGRATTRSVMQYAKRKPAGKKTAWR